MQLPSRSEIHDRLEEKLLQLKAEGVKLDMITFAGNGEPTIHPEFEGIINDTLLIRDRIMPGVKIAVLSNASRLDKPAIFEALKKVEMNILKLDSANEHTVKLMNQPPPGYSVAAVIEGMMRYEGHFILQTLFVQGEFNGELINNSSEEEVNHWMEVVKKVNPEMVMIYTIARDTPIQSLAKIEASVLDKIAARVRELGFPVQVSY
jgi:wyosine [tRNA(Phe)-imidazoG37] synthetase (radical SAM superfamily)